MCRDRGIYHDCTISTLSTGFEDNRRHSEKFLSWGNSRFIMSSLKESDFAKDHQFEVGEASIFRCRNMFRNPVYFNLQVTLFSK